MEVKYDYKSLIKYVQNIYNVEFIEAADMNPDKWDDLMCGTITTIKEKLLEFTTDQQRIVFLCHFVDDVFLMFDYELYYILKKYVKQDARDVMRAEIFEKRDRGVYAELEEPAWFPFFLNEKVFMYTIFCLSTLTVMMEEISKVCSVFYLIGFDQILFAKTSSVDEEFCYYRKDGSYKELGEVNTISKGVAASVYEFSKTFGKTSTEIADINEDVLINEIELKKSNKDVFKDITLQKIFYSQYTKRYQLFFDILKEKQYEYIDSDNCWKTEAHAFQYFKELQSENFKVIRTKYGANKKVITDKLVGELFKDYFGLKPHNFTSKLPILPENEIKFRKAIQSVKSQLD